MKKYLVPILLGLWIGISGAQPLENGKKLLVAIPDLEPNGVSRQLSQSVTDGLRARLAGRFTLVSREDIKAVLEEHAIQQVLTSEAVEMGKILGATKMIFGNVTRMEQSEAFGISLRMVDVEQGKVDLAESVDIIPREQLETALDYLAVIVKEQIPITGKVVRVNFDDTVELDLGYDSGIEIGKRFEIIQNTENVKIQAGYLEITKVGSVSSSAQVLEKKSALQPGFAVVHEIDTQKIKSTRNLLQHLGDQERVEVADRIQKAELLRKKKLETDIEREKKRRIANLPINKFNFGLGNFIPGEANYKNTYYDGTKFSLKQPVYQMTVFLGNHRYFRFYLEGSYFKHGKAASDSIAGQPVDRRERILWSAGGGIRVQFPVMSGGDLVLVPYGGLGLNYTFLTDRIVISDDNILKERSTNGSGSKLFFGLEFIIAEQIGIYYELVNQFQKIGGIDISGTISFLGVDVWF